MHLLASEQAVKQLLSFFPPTQSIEPKAYIAAMVQLFSEYPDSWVARAIHPTKGLPCMSEFAPSLKQAKDFFKNFERERAEQAEGDWQREKHAKLLADQMHERETEKRDPEMKQRVQAMTDELVAHLKSGASNGKFIPQTSVMKRPRVFIPKTDYRFQRFLDWAKVAHPNLWQFGESSDGRDGIWIDYRIWQGHESFTAPKAEPFPKEPRTYTADELPKLTEAAKAALRGEMR